MVKDELTPYSLPRPPEAIDHESLRFLDGNVMEDMESRNGDGASSLGLELSTTSTKEMDGEATRGAELHERVPSRLPRPPETTGYEGLITASAL